MPYSYRFSELPLNFCSDVTDGWWSNKQFKSSYGVCGHISNSSLPCNFGEVEASEEKSICATIYLNLSNSVSITQILK